jgi:hypothetical protein
MKTVPSTWKHVVRFLPVCAFVAGCQGTDVELAKPEKAVVINPMKPEDAPKELKPGKGSSAGMTYDPSGVNGPPPSPPPRK